MFVTLLMDTLLMDVGRFCPTVKYGRCSRKGGKWHVDIGSGPRVTPPSLELARVEALSIREILQERVNRPPPVVPTLALLYSHGLRPAHRVPGRVQPQAAALGSGGLHW